MLKKFTSEDYEKLPDCIENVEDLPHPKHHREYLAYHLRYLSKSQGQENIWDDSMIKDYLERRKLNDENYEKHISKVNNAEKEFLLKHSMDLARYSKLLSEYKSNNHQSLINYVKFINSLSPYPKSLKPKKIEYEYNSDDKILLISLSLPDFERVPMRKLNKKGMDYLKPSKTEINKVTEYCTYMIAIRTIYETYFYDHLKYINNIALNGSVESFNKSTGNLETNTILSLLTKREEVEKLNLNNLDPKECFRSLKGVSAAKIQEKIPIQPIITFEKDKRLVDSKDILENLKEENLAVMKWEDFEHLIRELFAKEFSQEGAEVKITQASRDKGVDAIAYDPDPIRGGKFVIQAKRYTATVDVSSVRDLYGTIMNEGANRGILVTTAKYGSDSYEFARDKNITLISGSELLGLLSKHGYNFKIDINEARKILNLTSKKTY